MIRSSYTKLLLKDIIIKSLNRKDQTGQQRKENLDIKPIVVDQKLSKKEPLSCSLLIKVFDDS